MKAKIQIVVVLLLVMPAVAQQYETVYSARLRNGFAVRHYSREVIGEKTRLYLGREAAAGFAEVPTAEIESIESERVLLASQEVAARQQDRPMAAGPTSAKSVQQLVSDAAARTSIDQDFINSVIHAESGFNPKARSPKGAQGLMQLMPQTAAQLGVADAYDAEANVSGGSEYLRQLLELYHGDAQKALAAYNAGPQRVRQYGGVPPYRETRAYVARVINEYNRKKLSARKQKPTGGASGGK